jgi:hypothetical protein
MGPDNCRAGRQRSAAQPLIEAECKLRTTVSEHYRTNSPITEARFTEEIKTILQFIRQTISTGATKFIKT